MTTFYTSDLHFEHKHIVEYTDRKQVVTQAKHTEWLIELWNQQVQKGDLVYILGDLFFCGPEQAGKIMKRLNGTKAVIKGNHDRTQVLDAMLEANLISSWTPYKELTVNVEGKKQKICLMHYPLTIWNQSHHGSWQLFGHSHSTHEGKGLQLDVGIDNAYKLYGEHRLFSVEDIHEYMQSRKPAILDHHTDSTN